MESSRECVCCKEISMIMDKLDELEESSHVRVGCITEHPGFATVCLDPSDSLLPIPSAL